MLTAECGDRSGSARSQGLACVAFCATIHYRWPMSKAQTKDYPLSMRLPQADVAVIDRAARIKGRSRTEFVRDAAVREAEATILDSILIQMNAAGFKSFMDTVNAPPAVNNQLLAALEKSKAWDGP